MASCTYVCVLWLVLKLVSGFVMPMTNSGGVPDVASVIKQVTLLEQMLNTQIQTSNNQVGILTSELAKNKQDVHDMKIKVETTGSDMRNVQAELNTTEDKVTTLESQLQATRLELGSTNTKLQRAIFHIDFLTSGITSKIATLEETMYYIHSNLSQRIDQTSTDIAFQVAQSASKSGWKTLTFDTVDYNLGGGYNPTSGYFTAPVSGTYIIWVNILMKESIGDIHVYKNSKMIISAAGHAFKTGLRYNTASATTVIHLNTGDTIHFMFSQVASVIYGYRYSQYGGVLMHVGSVTI